MLYFAILSIGRQVVVRVECLLLHEGDTNNVLPIVYRSVPQY